MAELFRKEATIMNILFMGTPEFAIPSLKTLAENGYNVVGAVTQPDKPKGRGRKYRIHFDKIICDKIIF